MMGYTDTDKQEKGKVDNTRHFVRRLEIREGGNKKSIEEW
jgi:hypothetical protein